VYLLVDLGGTNCRCALSTTQGNIFAHEDFINRKYDSLTQILGLFLERQKHKVEYAAVSVAAPVRGSRVRMTNLPWVVCTREIESALGLGKAVLLNDFAAVALALPYLEDSQLIEVKTGDSEKYSPKVLLGPGTGLGVGGLIYASNQWHPVAGEGGHVTQSAISESQREVLRELYGRFDHVSAEKVNSGMGLQHLYQALSAGNDKKLLEIPEAEEITSAAIAGEKLARKALDLFYEFLAINAGNLALTFGAMGGIYLAGGILPKIKTDFLESGFVEQLLEKDRFAKYIDPIPVYLIVEPYPAFIGLNRYLNYCA